jgi:hypothetical protein
MKANMKKDTGNMATKEISMEFISVDIKMV